MTKKSAAQAAKPNLEDAEPDSPAGAGPADSEYHRGPCH